MSQKKFKPANHKFHRKRNRSTGPLWLMLGGGIIVVIASFALLRGNSAPKTPIEVAGAPSLKVDKQQVDLGNETLGQTVQVSFELTNVGDQTLRFSEAPYVEVKEGC